MTTPSLWPYWPDPRIDLFYRWTGPDIIAPMPNWYTVRGAFLPSGPAFEGDLMAVFSFRLIETMNYWVWQKIGAADAELFLRLELEPVLAFNPADPTEFVQTTRFRVTFEDEPAPGPWRVGVVSVNANFTFMILHFDNFGNPSGHITTFRLQFQAMAHYDDSPFVPIGWTKQLPCRD